MFSFIRTAMVMVSLHGNKTWTKTGGLKEERKTLAFLDSSSVDLDLCLHFNHPCDWSMVILDCYGLKVSAPTPTHSYIKTYFPVPMALVGQASGRCGRRLDHRRPALTQHRRERVWTGDRHCYTLICQWRHGASRALLDEFLGVWKLRWGILLTA